MDFQLNEKTHYYIILVILMRYKTRLRCDIVFSASHFCLVYGLHLIDLLALLAGWLIELDNIEIHECPQKMQKGECRDEHRKQVR